MPRSYLRPAAGMARVLALYMLANRLKAMINPVFMLVAGALASQKPPAIRARRKRPSGSETPNPQGHRTSHEHNHAAAVEAG